MKGGGRVLFRTRTAVDAQALAAGLVQLRNLPETEREEALARRLEAGFDLGSIRERWSRMRLAARVAASLGRSKRWCCSARCPRSCSAPGGSSPGTGRRPSSPWG